MWIGFVINKNRLINRLFTKVKSIRSHKGERRGMQKIMPNREMRGSSFPPSRDNRHPLNSLSQSHPHSANPMLSTQFPHPIPSPLQVKHIPCGSIYLKLLKIIPLNNLNENSITCCILWNSSVANKYEIMVIEKGQKHKNHLSLKAQKSLKKESLLVQKQAWLTL